MTPSTRTLTRTQHFHTFGLSLDALEMTLYVTKQLTDRFCIYCFVLGRSLHRTYLNFFVLELIVFKTEQLKIVKGNKSRYKTT
jgi:hypothetical protein